jgi:hypothetical protein
MRLLTGEIKEGDTVHVTKSEAGLAFGLAKKNVDERS